MRNGLDPFDSQLDDLDALLRRARDGEPVGADLHALPEDWSSRGAVFLSAYSVLLPRSLSMLPSASQVVDRIGRYRVLEELGRGAQGVVYRAVDPTMDREVAIKRFYAAASSERARKRARREAVALSRLRHPGLCAVFDSGIEDDTPYVVMEFVAGETLAMQIAEWHRDAAHDRGRRVRFAAELVAKVAEAVSTAHRDGLVHRDLKPGNIVITPGGEPVVLDFGLVFDAGADPVSGSLTRTGEALGTPAYMAPEQIEGTTSVDARADVYALGVLLYELLTLRRPFDGPTHRSIHERVLRSRPKNPSRVDAQIDTDLGVVVMTAMARERADRYEDAGALARDLRAFLAGQPIAARPLPWHHRVVSWVRREPVRAGLLVASLACAGLGGFVASEWPRLLESRERLDVLEQREIAKRYARRGFLALQLRDASSARYFDQALACDPRAELALIGAGWSRIMQGDYVGALQRLADAPHSSAIALLRRDAGARLRNEEDVAEPQPNAELSSDGSFEYLRGLIAWLDLQNTTRPECLDRAVRHLTHAARLPGNDEPAYHHALLGVASRLEDPELMRSTAAAIEQRWPDELSTHYALATYLADHDPEWALKHANHAVARVPGSADAHSCRGNVQSHRGEVREAEQNFEQALAIDDQPRFRRLYGRHFRRHGEWARSVEQLELAAASSREDAKWLLDQELGVTWHAAGQNDRALECLERVLEAKPTAWAAALEAGQCAAQLGLFDRASTLLERSRVLHPKQPATLFALARLRVRMRAYSDGRDLFLAGLRLDPSREDMLIQFCSACEDAPDTGRSLIALRKIVELHRARDPALRGLMAKLLLKLGRARESLTESRLAAKLHDDAAPDAKLSEAQQRTVQMNWASALRLCGQFGAAVAHFEIAQRLEPVRPNAWFSAAEALEKLCQHEKALDTYRAIQSRFRGKAKAAAMGHEKRIRQDFAKGDHLLREVREERCFPESLDIDQLIAVSRAAMRADAPELAVQLFESLVERAPARVGNVGFEAAAAMLATGESSAAATRARKWCDDAARNLAIRVQRGQITVPRAKDSIEYWRDHPALQRVRDDKVWENTAEFFRRHTGR